jgi:pseudouridine synthase
MTDNDKQNPDQPQSDRPELDDPLNAAIESGDAIEAEAESAAAASDTFEQADDDSTGTGLDISEVSDEDEKTAPPPARLERLQKILAKSGISSRRHAEELITSGRVQVNGKVVTELGSKADPARDHIRVDGKLLQGSERHRYFMLNKPKGYVTTVSDPEGRPTIMEFFSKTRERLYPVGRLDYLSEGLLLVTNDGELANKLTRAASGVEKTYLVKVSGQPTEEELERLRQGVGIQKGKPGSDRVQTAPAEIRPFHPGKPGGKRGPSRPVDNPWYEVVLIEGRNRELRKMFEEIGHHVEKIRRVGYGPLILDLEPGNIRELDPEELENLRKAAEGKYRKPKPREPKREFKPRADRSTSKPRWSEPGAERGRTQDFGGREDRRPARVNRPGFEQRPGPGSTRGPQRDEFRPGLGRDSNRESPREFRPSAGRPNTRFGQDRPQRPPRRDDRESRPSTGAPESRRPFERNRTFQQQDRPKPFGSRPPRREFDAPAPAAGDRPRGRAPFEGRPPQRPDASRPFRPNRPTDRPGPARVDRPRSEDRGVQNRESRPPRRDRPTDRENRPRFDRPRTGDRGPRSGGASRPPRQDRPADRESQPRFDRPRREGSAGQRSETRSERPQRERPSEQRSSTPRPGGNFRPAKSGGPAGRSGGARPSGGRRPNSRPGGSSGRPGSGRPKSSPGGSRPKRRP